MPIPPPDPAVIGGLKKRTLKRGRTRSAADVLKATLRYVRARRDEIVSLVERGSTKSGEAAGCEAQLALGQEAVEILSTHCEDLARILDTAKTVTAAGKGESKVDVGEPNAGTPHDPFDDCSVKSLLPSRFGQLQWEECTAVKRSESGTDGVLFAVFQDRSIVCVKAPGTVAAEIYGTWLAKRMDIPTPAIRIVDRNSEEGQSMTTNLLKACEGTSVSEKSRVSRVLQSPMMLIMEYVSGIALADMFQPAEAARKFCTEKFCIAADFSSPGQLHDTGKHNFRIMGKILALDVLSNNFDRLPCIWNNKGNPDNIMFLGENSRKPHAAVCIDNMVSCIDGSKFRSEHDKYVSRASDLLRRLLRVSRSDSDQTVIPVEEFCKLTKFLCEGNGVWPGLGTPFGQDAIAEVQKGFLAALLAFGKIKEGELTVVKEMMHDVLKDALTEHCTWGLERIHPKFILRIGSAMNDVAQEEAIPTGTSDTVTRSPEDPSKSGAAGQDAIADSGQDESTNKDVENTDEDSAGIPPADASLLPDRGDVEHRKMENRRRQAQRLEALNQILSGCDVTGEALLNDLEVKPCSQGIASPALLRHVQQQSNTSEVCVVM